MLRQVTFSHSIQYRKIQSNLKPIIFPFSLSKNNNFKTIYLEDSGIEPMEENFQASSPIKSEMLDSKPKEVGLRLLRLMIHIFFRLKSSVIIVG